ncbi:MAG: RNA methyltransferase [Flavobacteriaceae bacterium]|nr:RNA methyltransferase [Flavobacteriaceae bacterium]
MLINKHFKLLNQLKQKKNRHELKLFTAEGIKTVHELMAAGLELKYLFATGDYENLFHSEALITVDSATLKKISNLKTPNQVLGVFQIPESTDFIKTGLTLALDEINDPGNLGTIIRLCDWFGVNQLVCSNNTVDCYNPKVVQATMGSLARVSIVYSDLVEFLKNDGRPVYGTFLNGNSIYGCDLQTDLILVMGNEANGISSGIEKLITEKITIPAFGKEQKTESLNVATATAVILSEYCRRMR